MPPALLRVQAERAIGLRDRILGMIAQEHKPETGVALDTPDGGLRESVALQRIDALLQEN